MKGPADITAADIRPAADVEILNPDLHIATLNKGGRLALDITVSSEAGATCRPTATRTTPPSA